MTNDLAKRIIDLRESKNWTQTQLAKKMDLSKSIMSKIESGHRKITTDELKSLAEIFGVSTDYLLGIASSTTSSQTTSFDIHDLLESNAQILYNNQGFLSKTDCSYINDLLEVYFSHKDANLFYEIFF